MNDGINKKKTEINKIHSSSKILKQNCKSPETGNILNEHVKITSDKIIYIHDFLMLYLALILSRVMDPMYYILFYKKKGNT